MALTTRTLPSFWAAINRGSRLSGKAGALSFDGDVAYSYGVPVARKLAGHKAEVTSRKYSVTTSRHTNACEGALRAAGYSVTYVDNIKPLELDGSLAICYNLLRREPMVAYYRFQVGTAEGARYLKSDNDALRVFSRWVRMFWRKYQASGRPGSIGAAIDRDATEVTIYRSVVDSAGIISCHIVRMTTFDVVAAPYIYWSVSGRKGPMPSYNEA